MKMKNAVLFFLIGLFMFTGLHAVSQTQLLSQEVEILESFQNTAENALRIEIADSDKRTEYLFLTNFGTGDQVLYPGVADYIYSVTEDTSDSSLNLAVTGYSFANDTSDVNYMIFGDATVSWPDTVVSYTDKYINSTLYWIGCTESSGNLKFIFYNSSYAKVDIPGIYQLSIGIGYFDNP